MLSLTAKLTRQRTTTGVHDLGFVMFSEPAQCDLRTANVRRVRINKLRARYSIGVTVGDATDVTYRSSSRRSLRIVTFWNAQELHLDQNLAARAWLHLHILRVSRMRQIRKS